MTALLEHARQYLLHGLHPIPTCWAVDGRCGCGRGHEGRDVGKRPLISWEPFQHEAPHVDQVDEWWSRWPEANIATVTGAAPGIVMLDADGPEGLASLRSLRTPATTWLQKTGRAEGGWQQFFRHPRDGRRIGNRAGILPGLDVRGDGGFALLPPSLHVSGNRYTWLTSPDEMTLAELPDHVLQLLLTPPPAPVPASTNGAAEPFPEGQRNDQLYRLARSLVAKGLTAGAVTVALLEENRARCRPPLPEGEVREIATHATRQPDRPEFAAATSSSTTPASPDEVRPLGVGAGEFLARQYPPSETYIEGVLSSDGGGWVGGEEKLGKTYYSLDEAIGLCTGTAVCGRFAVPVRRRVFLLEEEDSPRRTQMRLRALLRGRGLDPDDPALQSDLDAWFRLEVWSGFTFDDKAKVAQLDAMIADFRPAVIYIDVLRKVTARDLNKAAEASGLLAILDDLRRRYGVVFRVLHHYRKAQGFRVSRGSQEIGGSFVLGAWAEQSLFFEPVGRKQGAVRVTVQAKDGPATPAFRLVIQSEGPAYAPTLVRLSTKDDEEGAGAEDLIIQAIASLPREDPLVGKPGVSIGALSDRLKKSAKTIKRGINRLIDDGRIKAVGQAAKNAVLYEISE